MKQFIQIATIFGSGVILGLILLFGIINIHEPKDDVHYMKMIHSRDSQIQALQAKYDSLEWVNYNLQKSLRDAE